MAESLLSVQDVTVRFGGLTALDHVDLEVQPGSITGLIGPNGAGKTTLFNVITGLQAPTSGHVSFGGELIDRWPPQRRARAGLARTFQKLELFVGLTVRDNLLSAWEASVPGGVFGRRSAEGRELVQHVLERLGLDHIAGRRAGELPTGLGRMVELGRALCTEPKLLLLDEPSSGLDAVETDAFRQVLEEVTGAGPDAPAVLLVEHDMRLVMECCHAITVLEFGRRIACGTPGQIRRDPKVIAAYLGEPAA
ncbi:MAG TPA: ABC transporter ATP-binding protein [Acidimicrobiales bacterium]|nr:ABC transporter ATP-binding protein [Acidimicrobiales bacterium]